MSDPTGAAPLSRDDRDELAAVAAAAARRNRPAHLVVAAVVLLFGSLALAGSAFLSRRSAERSLQRYTAENVRAQALIEKINEVRAETSGEPRPGAGPARVGLYDPIPTILTRLIDLAREAGITVGAAQEAPPRTAGSFTRREYRYANVTCQSVDDVLRWIRRVGEELPGMQVISLTLVPQPATRNWLVSLTFARLERSGN